MYSKVDMINEDDTELESVTSHPDYEPPSYEEEEEIEAGPNDPLVPSMFNIDNDLIDNTTDMEPSQKWQPGFIYASSEGVFTTPDERYLIGTNNSRYSKDEDSLYQLLKQQAAHPPRVGIKLRGHHSRSMPRDSSAPVGPTVEDFNLKVDMSSLFRRSPSESSATNPWHTIKTPPPQIKVYRGGFMKTAATTELDAAPDLETWCHRYISQTRQSWLPHVFVLKRKPVAWKEAYVKQSLEEMLRKTNYAGTIQTEIVVEDDSFIVRSPHWMNWARQNDIIIAVFVVLQLWIISWPILFFCTRRFEVVTSEWPLKKLVNGQTVYASSSEQEWLDTWGEAAVNLAYRKQVGWIDETMVRRHDKLRRAYNASRHGASSSEAAAGRVTALVGYVDAKTGIMISPDGRREAIGTWG